MADVDKVIKAIRESFGASIAVYRCGNCYQFYEILKTVFPDAEAYYDGNHVWTKIDNRYYDVLGETDLSNRKLVLITDEAMITSLSQNKYTDERRKHETRIRPSSSNLV